MNRNSYLLISSMLLVAVLLLLLLCACNRGSAELKAFNVSTLPVTNIGSTTATLNGEITSGWAKKWFFAYGTQSVPNFSANVSPQDSGYQFWVISEVGNYTGKFHADITGLTPGTRYYGRAGVLWGTTWVYGGEVY